MFKSKAPTRRLESFRIDNYKNIIAGTTDLINKAQISIQDANLRIQARLELRVEVLSSLRADPDLRAYAKKDRAAFERDISELEATILELGKSIAAWRHEIDVLQLKLAYEERKY